MIVQKLKPWVTFSAVINKKYKHGDELCVGGRILDIVDVSSLLPENSQQTEGVYITLDDGLGTISIVMPSAAYRKYKKEINLEPGSIILAYGRLHSMSLKANDSVIKHHPEKTMRVLCWRVSQVPEEENLEVGCE